MAKDDITTVDDTAVVSEAVVPAEAVDAVVAPEPVQAEVVQGEVLFSRNEMQDSIDAGTGALTTEALELRAEHGIIAAGETLPTEE